MACHYTFQGKTYEVHEFDDALRKLPPDEAAKYMPSVKAIPSAPFIGRTEAWVALALKRMIRYAAEHGYDKIAWTNGEQQVERYTSSLRKAVDQIEWKKTDKGIQLVGYKTEKHGNYELPQQMREETRAAIARNDDLGFDSSYRAMAAIARHADWESRWPDIDEADRPILREYYDAMNGGKRKVIDTTEKEDALSDAVGKAMAERILKDPAQSGTIEGDNIKIDDTGMAGFYDKIVPQVAKDVLKKLGGGKLETVKVDTTDYGATGRTDEKAKYAVHRDQPGFDITPEMRNKAMGGLPLFQNTEGQRRGYLSLGDEGRIMGLMEHADASTFIHESGHFFLDVTNEVAKEANAPAELKADLQHLYDWFGIKDAAEWNAMSLDQQRPYHEKFARGFEQYLAEGKAPTENLQGVFDRFKAWLLEIYQSLAKMNVGLSDDVRDVMGRMLGGEPVDLADQIPGLKVREIPGTGSRLLNDIKDKGGIDINAIRDITGDDRTGVGVKGIPVGLFKRGGRGLDDLATTLREEGWPIAEDSVDGGVQALKDLVKGEIGGARVAKLGEESKGTEADYEAVTAKYNTQKEAAAERYDFNPKDPRYIADMKRINIARDLELAQMLSEQGDRVGAAARRFVAENEDTLIDGVPVREFLDRADEDAQRAIEDSKLMGTAAECMLGEY